MQLVEALDKAGADQNVKALLTTVGGGDVLAGIAHAQELRQALHRFRCDNHICSTHNTLSKEAISGANAHFAPGSQGVPVQAQAQCPKAYPFLKVGMNAAVRLGGEGTGKQLQGGQ